MTPVTLCDDASLVAATLAGNHEAFGQIVSRYQSLVCSLAYNATGSLEQSEDLAQETFINAWRDLSRLRERDKLRAWLCGIARNRINNFLRAEDREPLRGAESLEQVARTPAAGPLPAAQAISREEAALLWQLLADIPENYREPLILFYREHQSIETVARQLELTEDAVKQRLSRGRKLLQEQMLAFVEGALKKTSPGRDFTFAVVAALPLTATAVKAAPIGVAVAKGGAVAKGALTAGTLGGIFAMLGGAYVTLMAQAGDCKSPRERQFLLQHFGRRLCLAVLLLGAAWVAWRWGGWQMMTPLAKAYWLAAFAFWVAVQAAVLLPRHTRQRQQIQMEDGTFDPAEWTEPRKLTEPAADKKAGWLKLLKFMAFGLGMFLFVLFQESWKLNSRHAVLISACMAGCIILGALRWRNYPRFPDLRRQTLVFPVLMAAMTLLGFNRYEYLAHPGVDVWGVLFSPEVLRFNLAVVFAYAALYGVFAWKHARRQPGPRT